MSPIVNPIPKLRAHLRRSAGAFLGRRTLASLAIGSAAATVSALVGLFVGNHPLLWALAISPFVAGWIIGDLLLHFAPSPPRYHQLVSSTYFSVDHPHHELQQELINRFSQNPSWLWGREAIALWADVVEHPLSLSPNPTQWAKDLLEKLATRPPLSFKSKVDLVLPFLPIAMLVGMFTSQVSWTEVVGLFGLITTLFVLMGWYLYPEDVRHDSEPPVPAWDVQQRMLEEVARRYPELQEAINVLQKQAPLSVSQQTTLHQCLTVLLDPLSCQRAMCDTIDIVGEWDCVERFQSRNIPEPNANKSS